MLMRESLPLAPRVTPDNPAPSMQRPLRILLIEDSEEDTELLLAEVRRAGFDPQHTRVETAEAMQKALVGGEWDIVISDYTLPQFSGLAALALTQQHDPDLPFIISSGNIGEDIAVEAMRAGAHDYVMKNNPSRLIPAIERELREFVVRRTVRQAQRELQENEARLHALVSNVPGVVLQLLREWHGGYVFPYVSYGSMSLLELSPRQLHDDANIFFDLIVDGGGAELKSRIAESATTMRPVSWEGRIRGASSQTEKWIEIRLSPRALKGNLIQWEGIMEHISQRKRAEMELIQSRQQLSALSAHLQKAKEIERTRIAREVHDDIGGNLTAIKIDLVWLLNRIGKKQAPLLEKTRSLESLVDRTMEITSRIARDLRPPLLDLGLLAAIEWEASEFQKRMEIPCTVLCATEHIAASPELAQAVFSVFREILTNISKHAGATRVDVDLRVNGGTFTLKVTDNGRGIEHTDLLKSGSFGLRGMLERARHLGGEISFDRGENLGTVVTARLPLEAPVQPPAA